MSLLSRKQQIALKIESTEGTVEAPGAADATMLAYDPAEDLTGIESFERNPARRYLTRIKKITGKQGASISWRTELKGSGAVGTKPAWDAALRACGFTRAAVSSISASGFSASTPFQPGESFTVTTTSQTGRIVGQPLSGKVHFVPGTGTVATGMTIVGDTSGGVCVTSDTLRADQGFEYRPASSGVPSATVDKYKDGKRIRIYGARGNVSIEGTVGEPVFLAFDFMGVYDAETDQSLLSPTYETTDPEPLLDAAAKVDGYAAVFSAMSLDMQNTVAQRTSANATKGILSALITERAPVFTVDPEDVLVATKDFKGRMTGDNVGYVVCNVGATAGNKITIGLPTVEYDAVGDSDREGISVADLTLNAVSESPSTGDDEVQIAMI